MSDSTPLIAGRFQPLDNTRPGPGSPRRARDFETAQTVMLREVPLSAQTADAALAHARTAKRIFHPSLITLFDIYTQGTDRVLLAYEYVPAQTLAQLSGGHPLNPKRAAELVSEVADAVATLHAHGALHGAISQLSVLVTMKGKAKLDRAGDPSLNGFVTASIERDIAALGDLLQELAGRPAPGTAGMEAINLVIAQARDGRLTSAATVAAMLRR
jgi:serine/threonine protein kinase